MIKLLMLSLVFGCAAGAETIAITNARIFPSARRLSNAESW